MVVTMCSVSVFADHAHTLTLACSDEDGAAVVGDEFVASVTLGTSDGIQALTTKIVFDPNDFEFGMSDDAKAFYEDFTADSLDYETFEEYYEGEGDYGIKPWIDYDYYDAYQSLKSTEKMDFVSKPDLKAAAVPGLIDGLAPHIELAVLPNTNLP